MRIAWRTVPGLVLAGLLCTGASAAAQAVADDYTPVTEDMLLNPPAGDWPVWRRSSVHWGNSH